ncbi:MAG: hypothetical protein FJ028_00975 [Chloroflexi bacterium]|nr:hypothetical protein [Chloroflexota bacterium]
MKLKRDVKWADGMPFTAHDVKFSYDVILSPDTTIGKATMRDLETSTVKDDFTEVAVGLAESGIPEVEKVSGYKVFSIAGIKSDRSLLNNSEPGDPTGTKQHVALSDKKARRALELGINKQELVDKVLFGKTSVATGEYPKGNPRAHSGPDRAQALLEEAGWKAGADGVREKGGKKLTLAVRGVAGNKLRDDVAAPYDPNEPDVSSIRQGPSLEHPLGTDQIGRDQLSRLMRGGRVSLQVGLMATAVSVALGTLLGALTGHYGRAVGDVIMRFTDLMFTLPRLLVLLLVGAIFKTTFLLPNALGR